MKPKPRKKRNEQEKLLRKKKCPMIKEVLKRLKIEVSNYNRWVREGKVEPAPKRFKTDRKGNLTDKMELDAERFPQWEEYLKSKIISPWDAEQG